MKIKYYFSMMPHLPFLSLFSTDCSICTVYAAREESTIRDEAVKLISDGLERQQSSVLEDLLSSCFPQQMVCIQSPYSS